MESRVNTFINTKTNKLTISFTPLYDGANPRDLDLRWAVNRKFGPHHHTVGSANMLSKHSAVIDKRGHLYTMNLIS